MSLEKFQQAEQRYDEALIERTEEIRIVLIGLISQLNCLFVGPAGTAKSKLADMICEMIDGKIYNHMLTAHTLTEEVFGVIDIDGYRNGIFRRLPKAMLQEADVCFLDEIWKSSSSILNSLLRIVNEKVYLEQGQRIDVPLKLAIAASNEYPSGEEGKALVALFDRFVLRKTVKPIATDRGLDRLLWSTDDELEPAVDFTISADEITAATAAALSLPIDKDARKCFTKIIKECRANGVQTGDRRLRQSVRAVRGAAWLDGADAVLPEHLEVLSHTLWIDPEEQPQVVAEIVGQVANPERMKVTGLLGEAEEIISGGGSESWHDSMETSQKLASISKELKKLTSSRAKAGNKRIQNELRSRQAATAKRLEIETT